ncbi:uncharacterized protein CTHT_0035650 [Thermochaetoides thermophila DSM 1495]|uniref:Phospholipase/carboxylesterase/thioesterase domain-containing protein n=1 Tax=Chaetomium thermophilum (strain DSM 1495 / CBS 144.50 / IMI 039719) TaxID=759272 RepID=G0S701_CHATD|nr:hypothetical protein CTHT_0035650 [Thermochaetoides thermophila DSM 1495]EGS21699.1 hypothetical protein CTHT_0035650 [Thermochaetoides thermophila DSM 1495]
MAEPIISRTPDPLPTITFPPTAPHTHTVIFLHGRGDNITAFSKAIQRWRGSYGRSLPELFPSFRWVFPQAPMRQVVSLSRVPNGPVYWPQWFDVWNASDFSEREEHQLTGLREMVPLIRRIIRREAEALGGRWDRVVLAGISMGGATSLHTLFNLSVPEEGGGRLAAFMAFCARCPFAGRDLEGMRVVLGLPKDIEGQPSLGEDAVLRRTPMLLEHCVDDPLVKIERGRDLRDMLVAFGAQVEWKEYPNGGHWFHEPEGLDDAASFLQRVVLGNEGDPAVGKTEKDQTVQHVDAMDLS